MIRAIIFDCFGVFYVDVSRQLNSIATGRSPELGIRFSELIRLDDSGGISEEDFNSKAAQLTGLSINEVKRRYAGMALQRDDVVLDFVYQLKATYKTGMLTNLRPGILYNFFTQDDLNRYFDDVVVSGEVGLMKPQPEIFYLACKRLGVTPQEAIFVDDTESNCQGAEAVGIKTVNFKGLNELKLDLQKLLSESSNA
jgi:epoxide hydrolase-like predicted phosphatase